MNFDEYLRINYPYIWRTGIHCYVPLFVILTFFMYWIGYILTKFDTLDRYLDSNYFGNSLNIYKNITNGIFTTISFFWIKRLCSFVITIRSELYSLQTFFYISFVFL